ncbi:unnamed protein product [Tilletia controversa]|uniref:Ubiquitin-like modifier-activating enzyme ATG7 n=2 Tax=Tilletia TaxID=13289 RepID=A0A177VI11_9BASI|nr:hypothetical protein CF336_g508 [Tilletia laevis]KAE8265711.1 hypothetical protein A4X03_0g85 [Tilletia caries]CAD6905846.1 unnamed protein product [Tilletia controversa]KAE8207828.1 hypothetical protein CF335_g863 [Tilletia laevis]CAD6884834.1 unnamed protein product [Tilletia caries]
MADSTATSSAPAASAKLLQYATLSSSINPSFWHAFADLKINKLQLSEAPVPLLATYSTARSTQDHSTGEMVYMLPTVNLEASSLSVGQPAPALPRGAVPAYGHLRNFNTVDEFKSTDKQAIFNDLTSEIHKDLLSATDPTPALLRFVLLAFADLKKYKFFHWFAFPALVAKPAWEVETEGKEGKEWKAASTLWDAGMLSDLEKLVEERREAQVPGSASAAFWLVRTSSDGKGVETADLASYDTFFRDTPEDERTVAFVDPSANPSIPGWPLRNLLAFLALRFRVSRVRVLCWKEDSGRSVVGTVRQSLEPGGATEGLLRNGNDVVALASLAGDSSRPSAVGWERNAQGKLAPKVADLGPLMDPARLADQAVDLNLKLMRWRIMPDIDLERVQNTKCLLLGAGTLGCYVARALLGWGVRNITFVDSSTVSFSNPVRQPLFEFADCLEGGKPKAECAAAALRKIYPGVNSKGLKLSIPMPGHPIPPTAEARAQAKRDITTLESLIDSHDAVFLLMDSRESRWLPTMLCASRKDKIVLNAALGFDTYLVMRHGAGVDQVGAQDGEEERKRLGCYFCNDIVAPADSLRDRTLDQMCTVTRPGLAPIAAASAVELLVSVLQHKDGVHAKPPPLPNTSSSSGGGGGGKGAEAEVTGGVLGVVPHQIRGFLSTFTSMLIVGPAYERCTACSPAVVAAYREEGEKMLFDAFGEEGYLEKLTGLDKLMAETDGLLDEELDWDEEDEEEEEGGGKKEEEGDGELL